MKRTLKRESEELEVVEREAIAGRGRRWPGQGDQTRSTNNGRRNLPVTLLSKRSYSWHGLRRREKRHVKGGGYCKMALKPIVTCKTAQAFCDQRVGNQSRKLKVFMHRRADFVPMLLGASAGWTPQGGRSS